MIREAVKGDSRELAEMLMELYSYHKSMGVDTYESLPNKTKLKSIVAGMIENKDDIRFYILVEDKNETAGYIAITDFGKDDIINYLYIREKYRGNGYGRKLIDFAKNRAIENKKEGILISNMVGNDTAEKIYDKMGFKAIKVTRRLAL